MQLLIWGEADSLDMIEIAMEFEEVFDIIIDDQTASKLFASKSSYLAFLIELMKMIDPDTDLKGLKYSWEPFSLPPNYYKKSLVDSLRRRLPLFWATTGMACSTNGCGQPRPSAP